MVFKHLFGGKHKSGYGSGSKANKVASELGKDLKDEITVLITGANSGLGFESVKAFIQLPKVTKVFIGCRNQEKVDGVVKRIKAFAAKQKSGLYKDLTDKIIDEKLIGHPLDLNDTGSIKAFGKWFYDKEYELDILLNNAGIMGNPKLQTTKVEGYERQFGVNYLGHWLLTQILLPSLIKTSKEGKELGSRIINVSSAWHKKGVKVNYDDLKCEKGYKPYTQYGISKVGNIWHATKLHQLFQEEKFDNISTASLHPGVVATNLLPGASGLLKGWILKTPQQGAATQVWASLEPKFESGEYLSDCYYDTNRTKLAKDQGEIDAIWKWSCKNFGYGETIASLLEKKDDDEKKEDDKEKVEEEDKEKDDK